MTWLWASLGKWIELPHAPSTILFELVPVSSALLGVIRPVSGINPSDVLDLIFSGPPEHFTLTIPALFRSAYANPPSCLLSQKQTQPNPKLQLAPYFTPAPASLFSIQSKVLKRFVSLSASASSSPILLEHVYVFVCPVVSDSVWPHGL